ncbi:hypothetical protein GCM10007921_36150 [Tritonibacter mobilis]|nr:hypothetical protein GCM10007921_36150 [Tritonibacter mobilis]
MCIHWLHCYPMKDVGFRIRVQRELRESFLEACKAEDKPAAQVLREFMRTYVRDHNNTEGADADAVPSGKGASGTGAGGQDVVPRR